MVPGVADRTTFRRTIGGRAWASVGSASVCLDDNIKKVISWTLPTNAGEAMTIIVALFAGMSLPITAVQILWINLITAVTLGLALAFEPSEPGTMHRPPRPRDEPLLTGGLIWHIVLVATLFLGGGLRDVFLRDRTWLPGRLGPDHRDEHACGARDLPPVLHAATFTAPR